MMEFYVSLRVIAFETRRVALTDFTFFSRYNNFHTQALVSNILSDDAPDDRNLKGQPKHL